MITCAFENGNKAQRGLRHVTVGAIVVNDDNNQVLLVKRAEKMHNGGKFTIPGGFLDRDEDTKQGTLRELKEEAGYEGEIISLFRINTSPTRPKEDRQNVDFIYIVKLLGGESATNSEVTNIQWVGKDELPQDTEFAFDHRDSIIKYFEYLEQKFPLPIIS